MASVVSNSLFMHMESPATMLLIKIYGKPVDTRDRPNYVSAFPVIFGITRCRIYVSEVEMKKHFDVFFVSLALRLEPYDRKRVNVGSLDLKKKK